MREDYEYFLLPQNTSTQRTFIDCFVVQFELKTCWLLFVRSQGQRLRRIRMGKESATRSYVDQKDRWAYLGWSLSLTTCEQQRQKLEEEDEGLQQLEAGDGVGDGEGSSENPNSEAHANANNSRYQQLLLPETSHDSNRDMDLTLTREPAAWEYSQPYADALPARARLATLKELERDSEDEGPTPTRTCATNPVAAASLHPTGAARDVRHERNESESPGDSLHTAPTPGEFPTLSSFGADFALAPADASGAGRKPSSEWNASFATPPRRTPAPAAGDNPEAGGSGLRSALSHTRSRSPTPAAPAPASKTASTNEADMYIIQHHHLLACLERAVVRSL